MPQRGHAKATLLARVQRVWKMWEQQLGDQNLQIRFLVFVCHVIHSSMSHTHTKALWQRSWYDLLMDFFSGWWGRQDTQHPESIQRQTTMQRHARVRKLNITQSLLCSPREKAQAP